MKIVYLGFLGNCDESISKVRFGKDFAIGSMSYGEAVDFISKLKGSSPRDSSMTILSRNLSTGSDMPVYFIRKEQNVNDSSVEKAGGVRMVDLDLLNDGQEYLTDKIRLLRLIKNGFVTLPMQFVYREGAELIPSMGYDDGKSSTIAICHIEEDEVEIVNSFISDNKLPFSDGALELALESYELSYYTTNPGLSFISSVVAIESLLNPAKTEVTYRVSRNLAALLGKDLPGSKKLFNEMKKLYSIRSSISHGAKPRNVEREDLSAVREFARLAIVIYIKTGLERKTILDELHLLGFREKRPWETPVLNL